MDFSLINSSLIDFTTTELVLIALIFIWTGFVRSGLGFGGAALGLPLMLFIYNQPIYWLPIIGSHLLFFTSLTLRSRLHNVDWAYLKKSSIYIIPPALVGVFGLINLPNNWLIIFIYSVTLFYAVIWFLNMNIRSNNHWLDRFLLASGGYVAGTSLTGAPLMVAVYMRNVAAHQLRNTLFVLWFILVTIKMTTFKALDVDVHLLTAVYLLPVAAIGHIIGIKTHELILKNDQQFKRIIGAVLIVISVLGLTQVSLG
ncbi:MAG: sulfite exporter TauE/SafE family protein [Gammaproteobacteria bacterium]|nr:sulfite exporter TauE/SafE family protein [Gammaproteobacteria bacterium]